jgi:hypothetical protein
MEGQEEIVPELDDDPLTEPAEALHAAADRSRERWIVGLEGSDRTEAHSFDRGAHDAGLERLEVSVDFRQLRHDRNLPRARPGLDMPCPSRDAADILPIMSETPDNATGRMDEVERLERERKLSAIRAAEEHRFPSPDIIRMLAEIEIGYLLDEGGTRGNAG